MDNESELNVISERVSDSVNQLMVHRSMTMYQVELLELRIARLKQTITDIDALINYLADGEETI
jgi:hypothetical protein